MKWLTEWSLRFYSLITLINDLFLWEWRMVTSTDSRRQRNSSLGFSWVFEKVQFIEFLTWEAQLVSYWALPQFISIFSATFYYFPCLFSLPTLHRYLWSVQSSSSRTLLPFYQFHSKDPIFLFPWLFSLLVLFNSWTIRKNLYRLW